MLNKRHDLRSASTRLSIESLESRWMLATVIVDSLADSIDPSDGLTTLREAVSMAGQSEERVTITFAESIHGGTIQLTQGSIESQWPLEIQGPGADLLTIDASFSDPTPGEFRGDGVRAFDFTPGIPADGPAPVDPRVTISGLSITGGDVANDGGGIRFRPDYRLNASLEVTDVRIRDSNAVNGGGLAARNGRVWLTNVELRGNRASSGGGGLYVVRTFGLLIRELTASENEAGDKGGGVFVNTPFGETFIDSSVVAGNVADYGGGIAMEFDEDGDTFEFNIGGTDLVGNRATFDGGGLHLYVEEAGRSGDVSFHDMELTDNVAGRDGGGFWSETDDRPVEIQVRRLNLTHNFAMRNGGGAVLRMRAHDSLSLTDSLITENQARESGGGLLLQKNSGAEQLVTGNTSIAGTEISRNQASDGAGAYIDVTQGTVSIQSSTLSHNQALNHGGGLNAVITYPADVDLVTTTVSGNQATTGGGIYAARGQNSPQLERLRVRQSTVTRNTSTGGGGGITTDHVLLFAHNAIVAGNVDVSNEAADILVNNGGNASAILNYSLIGDNRGTGYAEAPVGSPDPQGNLIGGALHGIIDPLLGPLEVRVRETVPTQSPLVGSPAIDAGDPEFLVVADRIPGLVDMGAVESRNRPTFDLDFNHDSRLDCQDYEMLTTLFLVDGASTSVPATVDTLRFNISTDGWINLADARSWLSAVAREKFGTNRGILDGDANLDGIVDTTDLNIIGLHWQQPTVSWCDGNFSNGSDPIVDQRMLNTLGFNWLRSIETPNNATRTRAPRAPLDHRVAIVDVAVVDTATVDAALVTMDHDSIQDTNHSRTKSARQSNWNASRRVIMPNLAVGSSQRSIRAKAVHRSPQEIMDEIATSDGENAEVLTTVRALL